MCVVTLLIRYGVAVGVPASEQKGHSQLGLRWVQITPARATACCSALRQLFFRDVLVEDALCNVITVCGKWALVFTVKQHSSFALLPPHHIVHDSHLQACVFVIQDAHTVARTCPYWHANKKGVNYAENRMPVIIMGLVKALYLRRG